MPDLLKDINTSSAGSSPAEFVEFNGVTFFRAKDGFHGPELWKTDGTKAGTKMVKDISPGSTGSDPRFLTVFNGMLYF